jgi:hypothetical protein
MALSCTPTKLASRLMNPKMWATYFVMGVLLVFRDLS